MARHDAAANHVKAKATSAEAKREAEKKEGEDGGASLAGAAGVSKRRKVASTPAEDQYS